MKAIKYKVKVSDSVLAYSHGFFYEITEYFIPEKGVVFNYAHNEIHVFKHKEPRSKEDLKTIELDEDLVKGLEEFLVLKENLNKRIRKLYAS